MDNKKYVDYILEQAENLINIDSPSGYGEGVTQYLLDEFGKMGYHAYRTGKGSVIADLGGEDENDAILLEGHCDTLGAMVHEIKADGHLKLTNIGGMQANNAEAENVRVITKFNGIYEGTCQLANPSVHVNGSYGTTPRTWDVMEVILDEDVKTKADAEALGIMAGDYVCFEPRFRVTEKGYIKSRFLDDKLSTAILLGFAKYVKDEDLKLSRKVYQHITVFEEVGHGACASAPEDVEELLSVDMGCVGEGLECTDRQVSICVKDGHGPYHYDVVKALIQAAKDNHIDYAADVYPYYGSDADAALSAGIDARHGLIGPGVYASHGYERSHKDAVAATLELLKAYLAQLQI